MQPIVHLVVGYLCYAAYSRWKTGDPPRDVPALVAIGSAVLADVIDKPLYAMGVLPVGRAIGHSLLFVGPLVIVVLYLTRMIGRGELGIAFAIGYGSHLAADIPWHLLSGEYHELGFLFWPITTMPPYTGVKTIWMGAGLEITTLWLEAVIGLIGVIVWWFDGRPGIGILKDR